jgi:large subunit ribosomal protein L5
MKEVPETNPMRGVRIEKVVVNIGVGEAGERLVRAGQVLEMLTGRRSIQTISKTTNKDLGIRKGMPIGVKVTLRKEQAVEFFKTALWVRQNRIADYSFDKEGNCSFGIADYTDFPGQKYDPEIGIFGLSVSAVFSRPGTRVRHRRHASRHIPMRHRTTPEEVKDFLTAQYEVEVVE